jgi:hypothetical protein
VAQRMGRVITLLFHDRGTRTGRVVSSTHRSQFTPGKDPVPILQETGWAPGSVWTGGKSRPHRDSIPYRLARSSVDIPTELPDPHSLSTSCECFSHSVDQTRNIFNTEKRKLKKHFRDRREVGNIILKCVLNV